MLAQASVETIVFLAAVMALAVAVVLLVGNVFGETDISEKQSAEYWLAARPFSIIAYKYEGTTLYLDMTNEASEEINLTYARIDNIAYSAERIFDIGENAVVNITGLPDCGDKGEKYGLWLDLVYEKQLQKDLNQTGQFKLIGRCAEN